MKLIPNAGNDRVIDELRTRLAGDSTLDVASSAFSLFAYAEMRELLETVDRCRIVLPTCDDGELKLLGSERDRPFRNRLMAREKMTPKTAKHVRGFLMLTLITSLRLAVHQRGGASLSGDSSSWLVVPLCVSC